MKPISEMTIEEKNLEVAEWLNLDTYWIWEFHTDPGKIQLLREVMKREDWFSIKSWLFDSSTPIMFMEDYMIDTTGKLLDAVLEFKRRNEK